MATAEQVLDLSRSQLGNGPQKYWDWYPSGAVAWCCIYQSWVLSNSGLPTHFAWVSGLFDAMRADGRNTYDVRSAMPGDLIAFEWGSTAGGYDHIAMVESVDDNGVTAINGNWGGKVTRAWHSFNGGGIAEIARPAYDAILPPLPPTPPTPEEDEMKRYLIKGDAKPDIFLADAGLGWKWHVPAGQLKNISWVIINGGGQMLIPAGANIAVWEDTQIWVAEQAFVDAIPTIG